MLGRSGGMWRKMEARARMATFCNAEGMFGFGRRRSRGGEETRFYYRPSRRRRWWQKPEPHDDFEDDPSAKLEERLWRVAWWRHGWGVWPGDADPVTAPPVYSTLNIPHADTESAMCWAIGVVPADPRNHLRCPQQGDPAASFT
jgi:hypothetical protein